MSSWTGKMKSYLLSEEELGKKDDDHKQQPSTAPFSNGGLPQHWQPSRVPRRTWLVKRVGPVVLVLVVVWLFFANIPTGLGPNPGMRRPTYYTGSGSEGKSWPDYTQPLQPKAKAKSDSNPQSATVPERNFDGPVRFLELAGTLQAIEATKGAERDNRNVLFAASTLKSAANLLPFACQMGRELKSYIHFALLARSDINLLQLAQMNGIDDGCNLIFHDARVDHAEISSDARMESAVFRAFHHMNNYMHPQAIIVDGSNSEETFFMRSARSHAKLVSNTLIEMPVGSTTTLSWMTKLDSAALRMWDDVQIDILIHVPPGSSGGLVRLLKSLTAADYTSSAVPHLTIELPQELDDPTRRFLETFQWPPAHVPNPHNAHHLTLRHRIQGRRLTEVESSARFLESFWPSHPENSHVLVLSPQVEVSPHFFHYMKYNLLWYRYSEAARSQNWAKFMFGITLHQPHEYLDGSGKALTPPKPRFRPSKNPDLDHPEYPPTNFIWQSPSSFAGLYAGEKWMELHDFMTRTLEYTSREDVPEFFSEKSVSTEFPSWLEHMVRLARLRGYWMIYPGEEAAPNLAQVHPTTNKFPEEYEDPKTRPNVVIPAPLSEEATDEEIEETRLQLAGEMTTLGEPELESMPGSSLLMALPNDGSLNVITDLGILTWDGRVLNLGPGGMTTMAHSVAVKLRKSLGCENPSKWSEAPQYSTADLFCE